MAIFNYYKIIILWPHKIYSRTAMYAITSSINSHLIKRVWFASHLIKSLLTLSHLILVMILGGKYYDGTYFRQLRKAKHREFQQFAEVLQLPVAQAGFACLKSAFGIGLPAHPRDCMAGTALSH